jgi:SAM-dependent methyltransferase
MTVLPSGFTAHNVRLDDGSETFPEAGATIDLTGDYVCVKNMLQVVYPAGYAGKTIVDLGCLEGGFTAEFARLGLESTGIEVRESNLRHVRHIKERLGLTNLHFHQDDAWNVGKYGPFDIVFCVGLYYHIEDVRRFLQVMSDSCGKLIFLDTHMAPEDDDAPAVSLHSLSPMTEHEGMRGRWYTEHDLDPDEQGEDLEALKWHSWRNKRSFWPTKAALVDAMGAAGFDVVLEDFDTLGRGAAHALSRQGWNYRNERWMLVGIKL